MERMLKGCFWLIFCGCHNVRVHDWCVWTGRRPCSWCVLGACCSPAQGVPWLSPLPGCSLGGSCVRDPSSVPWASLLLPSVTSLLVSNPPLRLEPWPQRASSAHSKVTPSVSLSSTPLPQRFKVLTIISLTPTSPSCLIFLQGTY